MVDISSVLIFFALLAASAFFSGTETAITSVNEVAIQPYIEKNDSRAKLLQNFINNRGRIIAALLVGNNIVNTVLAVFSAFIFDGIITDNAFLPPWLAPIAASLTSISFLLIFGEVLPKNFAVAYSTRWSLLTARPTGWLVKLLAPLLFVLQLINRTSLKIFGLKGYSDKGTSVEEILSMARLGAQAGAIDKMEETLIRRASILNDSDARDVMISRSEICAISETATLDEIRAVFRKEMYSRLPVFRGSIDRVIGVLHLKEIFKLTQIEETNFALQNRMHPPLFVPESRELGLMFEDMRQRREHLAVVIDEFGTTSGIVTIEDILEFLVGAIEDEYDLSDPPPVTKVEEGIEAPGRLPLSEVESILNIKFPDEAHEDVTTIAGLFMKTTGEIPRPGAKAEAFGLRMNVLKVQGRRIERMRLCLL